MLDSTSSRQAGLVLLLAAVAGSVTLAGRPGQGVVEGGSAYDLIAIAKEGREERTPRFEARNRAQGFRAEFAQEGVGIVSLVPSPEPWSWGFGLAGYACGASSGGPLEKLTAATTGDLIRYEYGPVTESFRNGDFGLEHVLILESPPPPCGAEEGEAPPHVDLRLDGGLQARLSGEGDAVELTSSGDLTVLRYGAKDAFDDRGKELLLRLDLLALEGGAGSVMRLTIEAEEPVYPIRIDLRLESVPSRAIGRSVEDRAWSEARASDASGIGALAPLLAPPANDTCAGAITIPSGSFPALTAPVDVLEATTTGDPGFCITTDRTIWYTFTAPSALSYTFTTCASAGAPATTLPDTVLAVYSTAGGCAAPGPALICNDDDVSCTSGSPAGRQSTLTVPLSAGVQYYVVAGRYSGTGQIPPSAGFTSIQIRVNPALPPQNDACGGTVPALGLDTPLAGTTILAANDYTLSPAAPTCYTLPASPAPIGNVIPAGPGPSAPGRDAVYSFQAPAPGRYSFRVTGYSTGQNLILYISGSCPASPAVIGNPPCLAAANRNPASTGAEEVMCLPLLSGQRVYAVVDDGTALNPGSAFRIEVNRCLRETEPNGTPATANGLSCPIEGSIDAIGDVDLFSLGSPAAGSRVFAISDGAATNNGDQIMRMTTSADTLEFDDDDNDGPFNPLSPNVAGTPATGSAAFLRINPFSTTSAGIAEPYRLYAIVQPPIGSATAEAEPNNSTAAANTSGTNYFSGTLAGPAPSTDVDLYRFTAGAGALITLNLDGDPLRDLTPIDPKLDLLDAAGFVIVSVNHPSQSPYSSAASGAGSLTAANPFSPGEALTYRAASAGTFYARVAIGTSSTTSLGAGDYLLSIGLNCRGGDADADGFADGEDCAPADPALWAAASAARNAHLSGAGPTTLTWDPPASPGTSGTVRYDVLRSPSPSSFSAAMAVCLESDDTNTTATDFAFPPAAGSAFYYLLRAENTCGGSLGTNSSGTPRTGRSCP